MFTVNAPGIKNIPDIKDLIDKSYLIDKILGFSICLQFALDGNQKDLSTIVFSSFILKLLFCTNSRISSH